MLVPFESLSVLALPELRRTEALSSPLTPIHAPHQPETAPTAHRPAAVDRRLDDQREWR
jgi:hypothetical protein